LRLRGYTDSAAAEIRDVLDIDGDGVITRAELRNAFLTAGIGPTLDDLLTTLGVPPDVNFSDLKRGLLLSGERLLSASGVTIDDHRMRGISLPHIRAMREHAFRRCVKEKWIDFYGNGVTSSSMTHYDLVSQVLGPATHMNQCSFAELVANGPQKPTWMVVHGWGEAVAEFLQSLEQHAADRQLSEDGCFYYVCAYARNAHVAEKRKPARRASAQDDNDDSGGGHSSSSWRTSSFFRHALEFAEGVLCVVDSNAAFVSRAWPIFEVSAALSCDSAEPGRMRKYFDIYTALGHEGCQPAAVGITDGVADVDTFSELKKMRRELQFPRALLWALVGLTIETSSASTEDDRRFILNTIAGRSNVALLPFTKHASYAAFNADMRGFFASYALRGAVEAGGHVLAACLSALQQTRTLRELSVCFAECDTTTKLTDSVMHAVASSLPVSLSRLAITSCAALRSAEWAARLAECLESLSFEDCTELCHLPSVSLGCMGRLKRLNLNGCTSLVELPDTIGMLGKTLESLYLHSCGCITRLPSSLSVLEKLRELDLRNMAGLAALPNLSALKSLEVAGDGELFGMWMANGRLVQLAANTYDPMKAIKLKRAGRKAGSVTTVAATGAARGGTSGE
jgi:hypothetical protein